MKTIKSLTEAEIAELPQLPDGWKWVKIGEYSFVTKLAGFEYTKYVKYQEKGDIPVIKAQNISKEGFIPRNFVYVDKETMEKLPRSRIRGGEILMVFVGSVGNVGVVPYNKEYFLGPNVAKIDVGNNLNNKYVLFFLSSTLGFGNVSGMAKATTQSSISMSNIREVAIPFVAIQEQRAIVSKIELLFSELDNGIANLKLAQEQLKVYRQAVLKKAFEGELTKKWRKANPDVEDSKCILNKVKSQVSIQCQNKKIQNTQYDEAPYELPSKWNWASLSDVSISITDGDHQAPPKADSGVPFIVISNISSGKLDMSETMYVPEKYYENLAAKRKPQPRDLLYSVTGSYGIPILISKNCRFCFQRHIALIRPHIEISSKYLYYILKSPLVYKQATKVATGTAQLTVPLSGLRIIKVPLPPTSEQQAIVQEIETRLSVCDKVEQDIEENLVKAEALRQSILKKAFEGKLLNDRELAEVRRAEDWEPAEVLLERVRAEREGNGKP